MYKRQGEVIEHANHRHRQPERRRWQDNHLREPEMCIRDRYKTASLDFVEKVFTEHENEQEGKLVRRLVEEIRAKKFFVAELELIMTNEADEIIEMCIRDRRVVCAALSCIERKKEQILENRLTNGKNTAIIGIIFIRLSTGLRQ